MEAELDASLGYEKNQKGNVRTFNKRNGHSPKTLKSQYGEFQIEMSALSFNFQMISGVSCILQIS